MSHFCCCHWYFKTVNFTICWDLILFCLSTPTCVARQGKAQDPGSKMVLNGNGFHGKVMYIPQQSPRADFFGQKCIWGQGAPCKPAWKFKIDLYLDIGPRVVKWWVVEKQIQEPGWLDLVFKRVGFGKTVLKVKSSCIFYRVRPSTAKQADSARAIFYPHWSTSGSLQSCFLMEEH